MASSSRTLRSRSQTPSEAQPVLALDADQGLQSVLSNVTKETNEGADIATNARKRKKPSDDLASTSSQPVDASAREHHRFWYLCPVQDCSEGKSVARALKQHYRSKHPEDNANRTWASELAERVDFVEWLNGRTRGKPTTQMINRYPHILRKTSDEGALQNHAASASVDLLGEAAASHVDEGTLPLPPSKRSKLDQLLDEHKASLQTLLEQELKKARKKVKKAEKKARKAEEEKEVLRRRMQLWRKKRDKEKLGWERFREIEGNMHYHRGRVEGKYQRTDVPATGGFVH